MRYSSNFRPPKSLLLLATMFLAALFLAHFVGAGPTPATSAAPAAAENSMLDAAGQTAGEPLANCRYGLTTGPGTSWILTDLGAGVFYRWEADWPAPLPENDAELLRMIRPRQHKTSSGEYLPTWYTNIPLDENLAEIIRSDPGAVWMIGNEVERGPNPGETWSPRTDDMFAGIYAEAYHDIYHFIKGIDPTARIANAGLIQITPMRLQYLDMMWDAYERKYGVPMPVDVWTIHTYVLPELTFAGEANNIASVANGTDPALGKRGSGGLAEKCPDSAVYCFAEHDDPALLEEQVISMRQWMKDHDQQEKPLVVTEYGTLYHYFLLDDGTCRMRDENGHCFTPERVSKFMLETFAYFNNARSPALGMPSDEDKLVQQWIWYGAWNWDIASADLLQNDLETLTLMGETFRDHVFAEPTSVNLLVDEVSGTVIAQDEENRATAQLAVSFRNNGNVAIETPFTATFYKDAALTQVIDSVEITPIIRGCATRAYSVELEWEGLAIGNHPFWVQIDSNNAIVEADKSDNIGAGEVAVTGPVYTLDVQIVSAGHGTGGTVDKAPLGPTYPAGTVVTLTAVPYAGWRFTGWQGAIIGSYPQASVSMMSNMSVEAHFLQDHYSISAAAIGAGEVSITPLQDYYVYGDQVTIVAIPAAGWRFVEWRGDVDANTTAFELSVAGNTSVTAVFEKIPYETFSPVILGGNQS